MKKVVRNIIFSILCFATIAVMTIILVKAKDIVLELIAKRKFIKLCYFLGTIALGLTTWWSITRRIEQANRYKAYAKQYSLIVETYSINKKLLNNAILAPGNYTKKDNVISYKFVNTLSERDIINQKISESAKNAFRLIEIGNNFYEFKLLTKKEKKNIKKIQNKALSIIEKECTNSTKKEAYY